MDKKIVSATPISDVEADVEIVNSIKDKYKEVRQMSKAPSFALT